MASLLQTEKLLETKDNFYTLEIITLLL